MIRNKETGTNEFRTIVSEIAMLVGYEALRNIELEDVEIEKEILFYCYRQHKAMPHKVLYAKPTEDTEEMPTFYYLGKNNPLSVEETLKKVLDNSADL